MVLSIWLNKTVPVTAYEVTDSLAVYKLITFSEAHISKLGMRVTNSEIRNS